MRPQVETDYRAATVKQRPTSRRITPAEISVRYHTDVCNYATKLFSMTQHEKHQTFYFYFYKLCNCALTTLCICVHVQSLFERQGLALHGPLHPALEKAHIQLPKGMSRTKSFGKLSSFTDFCICVLSTNMAGFGRLSTALIHFRLSLNQFL